MTILKVKCIKDSFYFPKNKLYTAHIENRDNEIIELYIKRPRQCGITIAQVMRRFYLKNPKDCWYFDFYFKSHFEIIKP